MNVVLCAAQRKKEARLAAFDCRGSADYRVETGYVAGDSITGVYDGCLARFMTRARDCAQAFSKMRDWLKAFRCDGVKTNLAAIWNLDSVKFFDLV